MRRLSLLLMLLLPVCWAGKQFTQQPGEQVVGNQIIVKFKAGVLPAAVLRLFVGDVQTATLRLPDTYVVQLPPGISTNAIAQLAAHQLVDFVEPNRIRGVSLGAPNDPSYGSNTQWGLFTVQAAQAWNWMGLSYLTAGTPAASRVKVAVLDTGVDCGHPDFINSGGTSTDAAAGGQLAWSGSQAFVPTTVASPVCAWQDDHGHGTHVTGIVAAATSNSIGISSLGFPLQVLAYKVLDSSGSGTDSTIASAIVAAVSNGARVISVSLGGAGYSQTL